MLCVHVKMADVAGSSALSLLTAGTQDFMALFTDSLQRHQVHSHTFPCRFSSGLDLRVSAVSKPSSMAIDYEPRHLLMDEFAPEDI